MASRTSITSRRGELTPALDGVSEEVWIEVIQKMDEVYNDLLEYEVALEQKNAALEESHRFIASVLASMSDILVVCDRHGRIEDVNSSLQRITGKREDELRHTPVFDLLADEGSRAMARRLFADSRVGEATDVELLLAAQGKALPVSFNWTPRLSATGKLMGVVITGRPTGELRRAYRELTRAHEDLKRAQQQLVHSEKMASLGRLVAGVAHELNNPISFVLGNVLALQRYMKRLQSYLEAVHEGAPAAELAGLREEYRIDRIMADLKPLMDGMIEGAQRTRDIVDGLKRFSAVDRTAADRFNLSEVVERSVNWVVKAAPSEFRVDLQLPPEMPVCGSSGQLQQVVMNLVQNAADALAGRPSPRLEIVGARGDHEVTLTFRDNGPGIPPQHLPRIFDPFFTTKPIGQGTGLGLSISYGIVERHGGRMTVSNGPEGGAEFVLTLPLADAAS